MTTEAWGGLATLIAVAVGFLQWLLTTRAQARARDKELFEWGSRVLSAMARVESACAPLTGDVDTKLAMGLADEVSALVDQGRLFFRNVPDRADPAGVRVRILDEVLRCCYIAQHLAKSGARDERLRKLAWEARRRFITLLQAEMGSSLRKRGPADAGDRIAKDPLSWGG